MTKTNNITRRRLLTGLAALPAAAPVAATASEPESLEQHFARFAAAMADMTWGRWSVTVVSGDADQPMVLRQIHEVVA